MLETARVHRLCPWQHCRGLCREGTKPAATEFCTLSCGSRYFHRNWHLAPRSRLSRAGRRCPPSSSSPAVEPGATAMIHNMWWSTSARTAMAGSLVTAAGA